MRTLEVHKTSPDDTASMIEVLDEPGEGGGCCQYKISGFDKAGNETYNTSITFTSGSQDDGPCGVTNEHLLAIVIDRLGGFQTGPFACDENADALVLIAQALGRLKDRSRKRAMLGGESV